MHFFPLTCSDSLKINNSNCMLQDVFNLSLDFGYSCILSLSGKLGTCQRGITSVAFFFLLFSFTYLTLMCLWIIFPLLLSFIIYFVFRFPLFASLLCYSIPYEKHLFAQCGVFPLTRTAVEFHVNLRMDCC